MGVASRTIPSVSIFRLSQQFAQLIETLGSGVEQLGHDRLTDFQNFAVMFRPHGRGARLPREQRHFAKQIARAQDAYPKRCAIARDRNLRRAAQKNEHGIARGPFFNDAFAAAEAVELRTLQQTIELLFIKALEEGIVSQNRRAPSRALRKSRLSCGVPHGVCEWEREW